MAMDDPLSKPNKGSKIGLDERPSQVSDSAIAHTNPADIFGRPHAEFPERRHYAPQMHGRLLDKQA